MQVYKVGGAVRDALLGLPVQDNDWVVVGATPEQMIDAGYLPVGRDFPVFLHPRTREEYALARTERKTARGYHGFSFVTDDACVRVEPDDLAVGPQGAKLEFVRIAALERASQRFFDDPAVVGMNEGLEPGDGLLHLAGPDAVHGV